MLRAFHDKCLLLLLVGAFLVAPSTTALAQRAQQNTPPVPTPKNKVAIFENPALVNKFQVDAARYADAFDKTFTAYSGKPSSVEGWKALVTPDDIVGIHVTTPGEYHLAPPKALIERIIDQLKQAGVKPQNIIVWDKFTPQMIASGYTPRESKTDYSIQAVQPGLGYDPQIFYFNEIVGTLIWGDQEFVGKATLTFDELDALTTKGKDKKKDKSATDPDAPKAPPDQLSNRSHFAKIITQQCTKIINVAIMSDDANVGLYGSCASLAFASIDNMRRFASPNVQGDPAIAEVITHSALKSKVILHVMCGHLIQFAGGPEFNPHYTESAGMLLVSSDPVAIDTLALARIEKLRAENSVIPVIGNALHLKTSAQLGAGVNDPKQIQVISVK